MPEFKEPNAVSTGQMKPEEERELINKALSGPCIDLSILENSEIDHHEVFLKMLETDAKWLLPINLDKFEGLDHQEVALKMIEAGAGLAVIENLDKFEGLDYQEVALKIIESQKYGSQLVIKFFSKFKGLGQKVALALISKGYGNEVVILLDKFEGLDHQEVALKLIEEGCGRFIAIYFHNFKGLEQETIDYVKREFKALLE